MVGTYSPHMLMAFGGKLDTGQTPAEIWQCGIRFECRSGTSTPYVPDPQAFVDALADPLSNWFKGVNNPNRIAVGVTLEWIKCNPILPDGHYRDPVTYQHDYDPVLAGVANASIPNILGSRISWTTAKKRGPGSRGGVYLPAWGLQTAFVGSMRMAAGEPAVMLASGKELLGVTSAAGGALDLEIAPVIASRVSGTNVDVTGLRVGDVLDVQRRRKDALTEAYVADVWP